VLILAGKQKSDYGFFTFRANYRNPKRKLILKSYVASLFQLGINNPKVGEEAIEVVIEAKDDNDDLFLSESADLLFHYLIQSQRIQINDVVDVLKSPEIKKSFVF
jgi:phosphoribosyl-ATP pyrophosphohydrolase/phosphoribosyl-AMP cyclohydrolase